MWRNWNLNLPVNHVSSDEDEANYESPTEDPGNLVSPNRPHQSPSASPRALLRPDPPPVEEVLNDVQHQLRQLPNRGQRVANRNAVRQAQEAAAAEADARAAAEAAAVANMPDAVLDFDREDKVDGDKAQDLARSIKIEFEPNDVRFWFAQLEAEMTMASVNSQWLKKTVLQRNLPNKQKEDVKDLLSLPKSAAGELLYLRIKTEIIRIYAPKPQDAYKRALSRTMTGLPSQLGHQLVNDVCKKVDKFKDCCCTSHVQALWSMQLPVSTRAHVSDMDFNKDTYKKVFESADRVFLSSRQVSVAAVAAAPDLDETLPAFHQQNQPVQTAAIKQKKNNRNNRGGGGGGGGGNNQNGSAAGGQKPNKGQDAATDSSNSSNNSRGTRYPGAPSGCCSRHARHGPDAWYCLAPLTCPWVKKCSPRP